MFVTSGGADVEISYWELEENPTISFSITKKRCLVVIFLKNTKNDPLSTFSFSGYNSEKINKCCIECLKYTMVVLF